MTEADLEEILEACKPVTMILVGGHAPSSPQENANRAWAKLGAKMGFDSMTVEPSSGGMRFFTAVPSETEEQQAERTVREASEKKAKRIETLNAEISDRKKELESLT